MTTSPRLPFRSVESEFMSRSLQTYRNMVARFAQKENKRGRIIRVGRTVEFTLEDFRCWLTEQLGTHGGTVRCAYCGTYIDMANLQVDHMTPPDRGGGMGLDNLALACEACNQQKGKMLAPSYRALREWARENLPVDCSRNLFSRLQSQTSLAAWRQREMGRQFRSKTKAVEVDDGDF